MQRILDAEYAEKGALGLALFSWNASCSQFLKVNAYTAAVIVKALLEFPHCNRDLRGKYCSDH